MKRNAAFLLLTASLVSSARASEGFEDVNRLFTSGLWNQQNLSNPVPLTNTDPWMQGDAMQSGFTAQSGTDNSYIAANYTATGVDPDFTGTISAWLFAPTTVFNNGDHVQFASRTALGSTFADRLQVRLSTAGASTYVGWNETTVGNYTNLLLDINPTLNPSGYPDSWTNYDLTITGLSGPTSGRIAFRYLVSDSGPLGSNGNIVALDNYTVGAVPEPTTIAALGLGALTLVRRRKVTR